MNMQEHSIACGHSLQTTIFIGIASSSTLVFQLGCRVSSVVGWGLYELDVTPWDFPM
jgi:hypothetical protein